MVARGRTGVRGGVTKVKKGWQVDQLLPLGTQDGVYERSSGRLRVSGCLRRTLGEQTFQGTSDLYEPKSQCDLQLMRLGG